MGCPGERRFDITVLLSRDGVARLLCQQSRQVPLGDVAGSFRPLGYQRVVGCIGLLVRLRQYRHQPVVRDDLEHTRHPFSQGRIQRRQAGPERYRPQHAREQHARPNHVSGVNGTPRHPFDNVEPFRVGTHHCEVGGRFQLHVLRDFTYEVLILKEVFKSKATSAISPRRYPAALAGQLVGR